MTWARFSHDRRIAWLLVSLVRIIVGMDSARCLGAWIFRLTESDRYGGNFLRRLWHPIK